MTDLDNKNTVSGSHVIVSNFAEYGLGLQLNPDADPTDGQLDICVFTKRSLMHTAIHTVRSLFRAQNGRHIVRFRSQNVSLSETRILNAKGCHLSAVPLQTDGDIAGQLPISIRINAAAMQLLVHRA